MDDLITFLRNLISYSSDQLFSIYNEDRTKGNSLKLQYEGLGLDLRKISQGGGYLILEWPILSKSLQVGPR